MDNDQACDCMVRMAQPIANIADDPEMKPMLEDLASRKGESTLEIISDMLPKIVQMAMKRHRTDLYEIVGALTSKEASEVGKLQFVWTLRELRNSIDQDLIDFFKSSGLETNPAGN